MINMAPIASPCRRWMAPIAISTILNQMSALYKMTGYTVLAEDSISIPGVSERIKVEGELWLSVGHTTGGAPQAERIRRV